MDFVWPFSERVFPPPLSPYLDMKALSQYQTSAALSGCHWLGQLSKIFKRQCEHLERLLMHTSSVKQQGKTKVQALYFLITNLTSICLKNSISTTLSDEFYVGFSNEVGDLGPDLPFL